MNAKTHDACMKLAYDHVKFTLSCIDIDDRMVRAAVPLMMDAFTSGFEQGLKFRPKTGRENTKHKTRKKNTNGNNIVQRRR